VNVVELGEETYRRAGDYPRALIFEGREYSSGELRDMALRLAGALSDLGVGPGDRVAVMTPNCPEVGLTYSATWRIGAVPVPILFLLAPPEVEHILADSEPKVVVTSSEFVGVVQGAIAKMATPPRVVQVGSTAPEGAIAMDTLLAATPHDRIVDRQPSDLSGILYTGGTTGRPKGVMLNHGGMVAVSDAVIEVGDLEDGKVALAALPLAHGYGILTQLIGMRLTGTGVLMRWFDPTLALQYIEDYKVQNFAAVPTMLVYLLNHPDLEKRNVSSMERMSSGAAACPVEVLEAVEKRFGCTVYEGYGLTESTIVCCSQRPADVKVVGSVGKALPRIDVSILDDDNNPIVTGELGEICVKGPNVMPGYYRMPEATAETIKDGWLHTGDIGRIDADGNIYVVERKKDLIIRGGLNIYPRDVEEVLFQHPSIAEAAVVGRPDKDYGEEVVAFVVKRPGATLTEDDVLDFCRKQLAKYKSPKEVVFTDDLPKTGVGKILRRELRARAAALAR
jgi:long-chain acyl-CoA synthetase